MIEIRLECDDCIAFRNNYDTFEEAKAAYDEHMAERHPPDPRDVFVRKIVELLDGVIANPLPPDIRKDYGWQEGRAQAASLMAASLRTVVEWIKSEARAKGVKLGTSGR